MLKIEATSHPVETFVFGRLARRGIAVAAASHESKRAGPLALGSQGRAEKQFELEDHACGRLKQGQRTPHRTPRGTHSDFRNPGFCLGFPTWHWSDQCNTRRSSLQSQPSRSTSCIHIIEYLSFVTSTTKRQNI